MVRTIATFGLVVLIGLLGACKANQENKMSPIDIAKGNKSLLIYFHKDIPSNASYEFHTTTLSNADPNGKGYSLLDGIEFVFALTPIDEHEGTAVKFRDCATPEQIEVIKARVKKSVMVYKVFENIEPSSVTTVN